MIVEIPEDNSIVKWKYNDKDDWKVAEVSDLIKAYEMPKGEWIAISSIIDNDIHIICSHCKEEFIGKSTLEEWKKEYLFCHRCGAKMKNE